MLRLPDVSGIPANARDYDLAMWRVDVTPPAAVDFVRYILQFGALDVDGRVDGVSLETMIINGREWNYGNSSIRGFHLLEMIDSTATTTLLRFMLLPGTDNPDHWQLFAGSLPYLEVACDTQWYNEITKVSHASDLAVLTALAMAELAKLLPNQPWPSAEEE